MNENFTLKIQIILFTLGKCTSHIFADREFVMNTFKDDHGFCSEPSMFTSRVPSSWVSNSKRQWLSCIVTGLPEPSRHLHLVESLYLSPLSFRSSVSGRKAWSASCPSSSAWWSGAKTCMWIPIIRPAWVRDPPVHTHTLPTRHHLPLTIGCPHFWKKLSWCSCLAKLLLSRFSRVQLCATP